MGLNTEKRDGAVRRSEPNYFRIRAADSLWAAWSSVKGNGKASTSRETAAEIAVFEAKERKALRGLQTLLRNAPYQFDPARGVAISRPGKSPRPIVIGTVRDRVVQRALLNELQRTRELQALYDNENSFGGVPKRRRDDALAEAGRLIGAGSRFFVRSDIEGFFTKIPREVVMEKLTHHLDGLTCDLLRRAVSVELANADELASVRHLFPNDELGVAQGLCLSSLFGNVLLHEFDRAMNERGVRCLRYVDDFLILGSSERAVRRAFDSARARLAEFGMNAYDPFSGTVEKSKAEAGSTDKPFDFLGCSVQKGLVRPSAIARQRIVQSIGDCLSSESRAARHARGAEKHRSFIHAAQRAGHIWRGWRASYAFCPSFVLVDVQRQVVALFNTAVSTFTRAYGEGDLDARLSLLGLRSLVLASPFESAGRPAQHAA